MAPEDQYMMLLMQSSKFNTLNYTGSEQELGQPGSPGMACPEKPTFFRLLAAIFHSSCIPRVVQLTKLSVIKLSLSTR
jgi:hypothetical protein